MVCGFCICEFAYLLKFTCNPQISTHSTFSVTHGHARHGENLSCPTHTRPAEVAQGDALPSLVSSHAVNKCLLQSI